MTWIEWYNSLSKPGWTPSPSTISVIWWVLYPIIAVTFGFVFVQALRKKLPWKVCLPFAVNLGANLLFTPILFGLRNLPLAAADILVVWGDDRLDGRRRLAALPLGRHGPGAVLRVGVGCDRAATVDHGDEPVNLTMSLSIPNPPPITPLSGR